MKNPYSVFVFQKLKADQMYGLFMEKRKILCYLTTADWNDFLLCFRKDKLHHKEQARQVSENLESFLLFPWEKNILK